MAGFDDGAYRAPLAAAEDNTAGAVLALANPEGRDLYIRRAIINISTKSTGAGAIDAGIAANGTTSKDTLFDGLDVGTAAGAFDNVENGGTNGLAGIKWGAAEFLTATASADLTGMVGEIIIDYIAL